MTKYVIRSQECVLLTIDIQQKLFVAMDKDFKEVFLKNSAILLEVAKVFDIPILVSEQYPQGLGKTVDEIENIIEGIPRFEKEYFSCMKDQGLRSELEKRAGKTIIVIGIEAHVCVYQTVLDLLLKGYRTVVISDAVCSRRRHDRLTALAALENAGAVIVSTETLAFMLLEKAGTVQFKKLAPLFK
jgi:nicotinamidase-related amidase